ncbi:MAG: hypothetical protein QOE37_1300, partial [Microbacteriaceae bacterium]|nr:hypothetical protein [Microbacteriaceae bacterium]
MSAPTAKHSATGRKARRAARRNAGGSGRHRAVAPVAIPAQHESSESGAAPTAATLLTASAVALFGVMLVSSPMLPRILNGDAALGSGSALGAATPSFALVPPGTPPLSLSASFAQPFLTGGGSSRALSPAAAGGAPSTAGTVPTWVPIRSVGNLPPATSLLQSAPRTVAGSVPLPLGGGDSTTVVTLPKAVSGAVKSTTGSVATTVTGTAAKVVPPPKSITDTVKQVTAPVKTVTSTVTSTPKTVSDTVKQVTSTPKTVTDTVKQVTSTPKTVTDTVKSTVSSTPKTVTDTVKQVTSTPKTVTDTVKDTVASAPKTVSSTTKTVTDTVTSAPKTVTDTVSSTPKTV